MSTDIYGQSGYETADTAASNAVAIPSSRSLVVPGGAGHVETRQRVSTAPRRRVYTPAGFSEALANYRWYRSMVKPYGNDQLSDYLDVERNKLTFDQLIGIPFMHRLRTICLGGIPNVGKSTFTLALGTVLAEMRPTDNVAMISMDPNRSGLGTRAGLEPNPLFTNAVEGYRAAQFMSKSPQGSLDWHALRSLGDTYGKAFVYLPEMRQHWAGSDQAGYYQDAAAFDFLRTHWEHVGDFILADLGEGYNYSSLINQHVAEHSSLFVMETLPDIQRLRDAAVMIDQIGKQHPDLQILLVINRATRQSAQYDSVFTTNTDYDLEPLRRENVTAVWVPEHAGFKREDYGMMPTLDDAMTRSVKMVLAHAMAIIATSEANAAGAE